MLNAQEGCNRTNEHCLMVCFGSTGWTFFGGGVISFVQLLGMLLRLFVHLCLIKQTVFHYDSVLSADVWTGVIGAWKLAEYITVEPTRGKHIAETEE